ncbi:hypothetical protein BC332_10652 [Capsicum chinense]|nr:hypothetical protein BC332_10652 [Capsicum chinense]
MNEEQKFKCCLLWFLHPTLLAKDSTKVVDTKLIQIVDSWSFFESYPWGKETFQLTMDYLKKKSDLKKQREIWIYEAFPHLEKFAGKSIYESFSIPRILRWHTTKSDKIIESDPFKYKGKVTENVHLYIIPIVRKTKTDYMITFNSYTDKVKNNVLDDLRKELQGVTVLTSNEDSDDDRDMGGSPIGVCIGDDTSPSTSKDVVGTSVDGDLQKHVAMLEEAVFDIAGYIKEKRLGKKEKDERQHERVHVDLQKLKRNKEGEKMSKIDDLATVVAEEEMEENKSQEETGKEKIVEEEEVAEKEATTDEEEGKEKKS